MKVKFGDVVKDVKENVDRSNNPYEFYVAGDHMDSEDFRIHRRGCFATDDVGPAFVRIFHPGQILYGSRRTYLKKVCVADFEGVTANTTFVLETKDEKVLLQRLLPFLMLSKGFTDWSIKHSKGSTNPYVLFSDLAAYEFDLPPLEEQKKLAELLWAANDLKEAYKRMIAATDEMLKAKFREMFGEKEEGGREKEEEGAGDFNTEAQGHRDESHAEMRRGGEDIHAEPQRRRAWPMVPLGDIADEMRNGVSPSHRGEFVEKVLTLTAITQGRFDADQWKESKFDSVPPKVQRVKPNEFYICRGNGNKHLVGVGVFAVEERNDLVFPDTVIAVKVKDDSILIEYLYYAWASDSARAQIETYSITTNGIFKISQASLAKVKIPLPPLALQREFVEIARKAEEAKAALKKSIADIEQVIRGLVNSEK